MAAKPLCGFFFLCRPSQKWACLCLKLQKLLRQLVKVSQSGAVAQHAPCCCSGRQMFGCIIRSDGCFCVKNLSAVCQWIGFHGALDWSHGSKRAKQQLFRKTCQEFPNGSKNHSLFPSCGCLNQSSYLIIHHIMPHHATWNSLATGATSSASWPVQHPCSMLCILLNWVKWTLIRSILLYLYI